jgi:hypothetical protein
MYFRMWTIAAIYCYERGCRCNGCYYKENLTCRCRMKQTVLGLVKELGKPTRILEENEK